MLALKNPFVLPAIVAAFFFTACSDNSASSAGNDNSGGNFALSVETLDDLPNCSEKIEGDRAFLKREGVPLVCSGGKWYLFDVEDLLKSGSSVLPASSSDGWEKLPSSSSTAKSSSSSATVVSSSSEAVSSSSSALAVSSSSAAVSSSSNLAVSSSSLWKANWQYLNPDISYGEMADARDGQLYKTVQIGEQVWMAENLNFAYQPDTASFCYGFSADSCAKYGRLYLWSAAMDSAGAFSSAGKGCGYDASPCAADTATVVRGVCPEGWHLPSREEFRILFETVGGKNVAGTALKSTSGWNDFGGESGNGTGSYGFSALPAGTRVNYGDFSYAGSRAYFWSATESNSYSAYYMSLYYNYGDATLDAYVKDDARSVRCLRDSRL